MINKLDWDSQFFGINIAEINTSESLIKPQIINNFINKNEIVLTQACCDIKDNKLINKLEDIGFHIQDLKITFRNKVNSNSIFNENIRIAQKNDIDELQQIINNSYNYSRYLILPIPQKKVNSFYSLWVEKAITSDFDDLCLTYIHKKENIGFCTIKFIDNKTAKIGLIGVSKKYTGKGIGSKLILSVHNFLSKEGIEYIEVVTQGKNIGAQNFYIKNGFIISSIKIWLYKF